MKRFLYLVAEIITGCVGYHLHGSVAWTIVDIIFVPVAWIYWLVTQQVNLTVLHDTFSFLLK